MKSLQCLILGILVCGCHLADGQEAGRNGLEAISIEKISDHVYRHTSSLSTQGFGVVPCNGMIVVGEGEAIVFDTPTDREGSSELIDWVENVLGCEIKAVIPTHFHADCLGGLEEFHQRGIPSYANQLTIRIAAANESAIPLNGFDEKLELSVGDKRVVAEFFGEGHTKDNIIGYFPDEKVIFGGCLIKELGAGKGNLEDANIMAWPLTAARLKGTYPEAEIVIPGHGKAGGIELIDYTMNLFARD